MLCCRVLPHRDTARRLLRDVVETVNSIQHPVVSARFQRAEHTVSHDGSIEHNALPSLTLTSEICFGNQTSELVQYLSTLEAQVNRSVDSAPPHPALLELRRSAAACWTLVFQQLVRSLEQVSSEACQPIGGMVFVTLNSVVAISSCSFCCNSGGSASSCLLHVAVKVYLVGLRRCTAGTDTRGVASDVY